MGRIVGVQIESTLERKVKTRAFKGIFLVRRWINNTFKPNSVRYHVHHQKISPSCLVLGFARFLPKSPE